MMQCPTCGLPLADASAQVCPRCGHPLHATTHTSEYGYTGSPEDAPGQHLPSSSALDYSAQPPLQPAMPPNDPFYGQAASPSYPMYGPPGMPPAYPPAYPPGHPPYGQYGPYEQGAPVTTPFYGQAAPPSYPIYGTPPAPGTYPQPGWPGAQPQPKRGKGLVIGLSIGIVVTILIASIAAVAVVQNARNNAANISTTPPTTMPTRAASKTVLFHDALTSNTYGWSEDDHCSFASDGYHITDSWICFAPAGSLSDFDLTVHVKQISGILTHGYGVAFRRTGTGSEYAFDIDGNSKWVLYKCVSQSCSKLVDWSSNASLRGGLNVPHTLEIQAIGPHIVCFADGIRLGSADDSTFLSGMTGLESSSGTESVFSDMTITSA